MKTKNVKTKKYPKYWLFCDHDGKPGAFINCDCVKQTDEDSLFIVEEGREEPLSTSHRFLPRNYGWIEVSPQEIVLILGYLP